MRRVLLLIFLLPFYAAAQQGDFILSGDSLKMHPLLELDGNYWKFHEGDDSSMSDPAYDDSKWTSVSPVFTIDPTYKRAFQSFSSIGWFRLHITVDSAALDIPLAVSLQHFGASEIYFDGKRVAHYGVIKGKDSSVYANPCNHPFSFVVHNPGRHVLAVRYANFDAAKNYKVFNTPFTGFIMAIGNANYLFYSVINNYSSVGFYSVLLFAIFLTLFVLHLFLYIFYRAIRSNLFFSIFCLGLSAAFLLTYLNVLERTPFAAKIMGYSVVLTISILIASLSGFINELFGRKKLRFKIVAAVALLNIPVSVFFEDASGVIYLALSTFVLLEAVVLTISGIVHKVRGARIIGIGILFFALFLIFIFGIGLVKHNLVFSGESGELVLLTAFMAILSIPASMSIYLSRNVATLNRDLTRHLHEVEKLSAQALEQAQEKKQILEGQNEMLEREVAVRTMQIEQQHNELKKEKKKSDDLLLNILPAEVAEELKEKGNTKAKLFEHVTVLFTDFVGFTRVGERMTPQELIDELDTCFKAFDDIMSRHSIEKIKTIGDAYLAICGLPEPVDNHACNVVAAALEIGDYMAARYSRLGDKTFEIRIGIHSGSVVAGIVGIKKFAYDIWGDTVNTAARMEQHGESGKVNISETTYDLIQRDFNCTYRGKIEAKNKGALSMYFVDGRK